MENVTGLLSMDNERVIQEIIRQFDCLGYHPKIKVLTASDYGVPQNRQRAFIIGSRLNSEKIHFNEKVDRKVTVADAISDLAFLNSGQASKKYKMDIQSEYQRLMRSREELTYEENKTVLYNHEAANHTEKVIERFSKLKAGQTACDLPPEFRTRKNCLYRFHPNEPARTVLTLPDDFIHYKKPRILTVREMARLQSFPDWFEFLGPKSTGGKRRRFDVPQYTQVGNAVPPLLAEAVGKKLYTYLEKHWDVAITQIPLKGF